MQAEPVEARPSTSSGGMVEQRPISRVVIIGTGLIGTSIGCDLSAAGYAVHLRDHKISHARVAAGLGAGTIEPPISADVDLVVVAVPPGAIADLVVHSLQIYPNATVTDVGSVKAGVLDALWQRDVDLGPLCRFPSDGWLPPLRADDGTSRAVR
jgi:prephenate dehydrogenase